MKRRYKPGDWFSIALDSRTTALGLITHACGSRLFGYFFATNAGLAVSRAQLKAYGPPDACARMLFGGAPLEELRWPIIATSLTFDPGRWEFPAFASRGAFGRTWTRRTFDPQTLQPYSSQAAHRGEAKDLPAAYFASATEVEEMLRARTGGPAPLAPRVVCDVLSPLDRRSLDVLRDGGRVQTAHPLGRSDIGILRQALAGNGQVELRLHAMREAAFDLRILNDWDSLRTLLLDTPNVTGMQDAGGLRSLRHLRLCERLSLAAWGTPAGLQALEVCGAQDFAALERWTDLEELIVSGAPAFDLRVIAGAPLARLTLAHGAYNLAGTGSLAQLKELRLHDMAVPILPDLSSALLLRGVELHGVRLLRDLRPLASAPALKHIKFAAMPQLRPADFECFLGTGIRVEADLGNRSITREVNRLLRGAL